MSEAIIVALITGGLSLLGVVITTTMTTRKSNERIIQEVKARSESSDAKLDKEIALLRAEVDELMREVRMHNNFAQRIPVLEERVEVANHRISDLERGGQHA